MRQLPRRQIELTSNSGHPQAAIWPEGVMKSGEDNMVFITHDPIDYSALRQQVQPWCRRHLILKAPHGTILKRSPSQNFVTRPTKPWPSPRWRTLRDRIQADHPESRVAMAIGLAWWECAKPLWSPWSLPRTRRSHVVSRRVIDDLKRLIRLEEIYEDGSAWANAGQ